MNKLFTLCILLNAFFIKAQVIDDFSDGDFTSNPTWSGQDTNFEISSNFSLHLNAPAQSDTSFLSTVSSIVNEVSWEFDVNLDFNPSSSNYVRIYVMSDTNILSAPLNGYYVKVGGSEDEISLFKQEGNSDQKIIDGTDDLLNVSEVDIHIRVTRSSLGEWQLLVDTLGPCSDYISMGTITDNTISATNYFGVACYYTSSRSDKFYFDNFKITDTSYSDNVAPTVTSFEVLNDSIIEVTFSEVMDSTSLETLSNYLIDNGIGNPISIVIESCGNTYTKVLLEFENHFQPNILYSFSLNNTTDLAGNSIAPFSDTFVEVETSTPVYQDIVFNEIMADPSPVIGLPEAEYLELFNTSDKFIDLINLYLVNSSTLKPLPSFTLEPGKYVIVCNSDDVSAYAAYGDVIGVDGFTALSNASDSLTLQDLDSNIIDVLKYEDDWHASSSKKDGGWSLERKNPFSPCSASNNWSSSTHILGGTPGTENSIFTLLYDTIGPAISNIEVQNDSMIRVAFNEIITDSTNFSDGSIIVSPSIDISHYQWVSNLLHITFNDPIEKGTFYSIKIANINDCSQNTAALNIYNFILPEKAELGDVIINEVLFNPIGDGADFIELYNNSSKYINIAPWYIANTEDDTVANEKLIGNETRILNPNNFILLSKNSRNIWETYPLSDTTSFYEMSAFPSYNNDEGSFVLLNDSLVVMDQFNYNEDENHFSLLNSVDGVSLERIHYDQPSYSTDNWHSASEDVGFATPGYQNSQFRAEIENKDLISIHPETFSPDLDGFDDFIEISYTLDNPGYVCTISVYTIHGTFLGYITNNSLLGTSGVIKWDGSFENNVTHLSRGMYIIHTQLFNLNGDVSVYKNPVVIAYK